MRNPSIFKTKPWHIQNPRHIHSTVKQLSWNILFKTCNADIFRTLVYSQLRYILKSKHIQSPAKYLRWNILLRTLCNYSIFRHPIYLLLLIQNPRVSATPMYQLFFRTTNLSLFLYPLLFIKSMTYSLDIWQNFGYGLRVKRKIKYWNIRKCYNITNNSKKRNSGK